MSVIVSNNNVLDSKQKRFKQNIKRPNNNDFFKTGPLIHGNKVSHRRTTILTSQSTVLPLFPACIIHSSRQKERLTWCPIVDISVRQGWIRNDGHFHIATTTI